MANIRRLMRDATLPQWTNIGRIGADGVEQAGELALNDLTRLRETMAAPGANASAVVRFARGRGGGLYASGEFNADIPLECQRCLNVVYTPVYGDFHLLVVLSEVEAPDRAQETVVALNGWLDLHALIEDELLLGLPIVARHEGENSCEREARHFGPPGEPSPQRDNPFVKLAALKRGDGE